MISPDDTNEKYPCAIDGTITQPKFQNHEDSITVALRRSDESDNDKDKEQTEQEKEHHADKEKCANHSPCKNDETTQHIHFTSRPSCESDKTKRRIRFDTVTIRDYGMILGDNPSCTYGPPVTLDWEYIEYRPQTLDEYESHRTRRRKLRQMNLSYYRRIDLLRMAGTSEEEIEESRKAMRRIKIQRGMTRSLLQFRPAETCLESMRRKFKRLLKEDHWKAEAHLYKQKKQ